VNLADSDVLVDVLRDHRSSAEFLRPYIRNAEVCTSIIVFGELQEGLFYDKVDKDAAARALSEVLAGIPVISIDEDTAREFGRLRFDLRSRGLLLPDNDLWIAATALRHDATLVSRDSHFDRIPGLKLLRPA
jgi:tRNA(fMet)-specific endonuclease VapC